MNSLLDILRTKYDYIEKQMNVILISRSFAETSNGGSHGDSTGGVQHRPHGFTLLLHSQIPTARRLTAYLPQSRKNTSVLRDFLITLRRRPRNGFRTSGDTCAFESRKKDKLVSSPRERARKADEEEC